jgi:ATP/maltotriose-dependent transcriptional regulator MalT
VSPLAPYQAAMTFEMSAGNHARALQIADDARAALDTVDNAFTQIYVLCSLATFEAMAGRIDDARTDAERAAELARRSGNVHLVGSAQHAAAWAFQRDDPAAALAAAEHYLDLYRESDVAAFGASSVMALAGGLRARLGDDTGALELFHEAIIVGRDQGTRPQLAAALDWALSPLTRTGRPDVAAIFLGALSLGALADVGNFPGVDAARARTLERVRAVLGNARTNELVAHGTTISYDELIEYALQHLDRPDTSQH